MTYTGRSSRYKRHHNQGACIIWASLLCWSFLGWQKIKGQLVFLEFQNLNWGHREERLGGRRWAVKRSVQGNSGAGSALALALGVLRPCSQELKACCLYRVNSFEGGTSDSDPLRSSLPRPRGFPPQPESCWEASCKLSVSWVFLCTGGEHCPFADSHKIRRISVWLLSSCWTVSLQLQEGLLLLVPGL